jgi:hypothetical protein
MEKIRDVHLHPLNTCAEKKHIFRLQKPLSRIRNMPLGITGTNKEETVAKTNLGNQQEVHL